jgi:hypothetical protein
VHERIVAYLDVHADQEDSAVSFRRSNKRRVASLMTCKSKLVRFFLYTDTGNPIVPCLVKSNDKPNKQAVTGVEGLAKLRMRTNTDLAQLESRKRRYTLTRRLSHVRNRDVAEIGTNQ